jgi:endonuclease/exonuclease/phosphatase family metal-dependent hydrolase
MSEQVRIATFNVRYLSVFDFLSSNRWSKRKEYINEFINELGADIIGMQEVTPKHREHFRTLSI